MYALDKNALWGLVRPRQERKRNHPDPQAGTCETFILLKQMLSSPVFECHMVWLQDAEFQRSESNDNCLRKLLNVRNVVAV